MTRTMLAPARIIYNDYILLITIIGTSVKISRELYLSNAVGVFNDY